MIGFTRFLAWVQLLAAICAGLYLIESGWHTVVGYTSVFGNSFSEYGMDSTMVAGGVAMIFGSLVLFCMLMVSCMCADKLKEMSNEKV